MVGRTLDRYRLLEQVGQGGMAVVYRALDVPLEREVAVKVLHPHLAGHPEARARLQREAQAVAKLRHENILEIFASSGPESAESYLVTEFIRGPTLKAFITDHPLPLPEIGAMLVCEIALALSCAHDVGIIHRDIKPENVMLRMGGTVVLCDFGIAQVVDKERMTATGQLLGSPAYMAPEHIEGRPLDLRSDVFSLGVLLYQLMTGELPFRGRNPHETLKKISDGSYVDPEELQPLCGARLCHVVRRALSRDPAGRYGQVDEMRADLMAALAESGIVNPRSELRDFFLDPDGWVLRAGPRIAQALLSAGRVLRAKGRTAAALSLWGRAHLLRPDDVQVAALIRGVARRSRLVRGTLVVLAIALIASLGGAAYRGWRERAARRLLASEQTGAALAGAPAAASPAPDLSPASAPPPPVASAAPPLLAPPPKAAAAAPSIGIGTKRPRARPSAPLRQVRLAPWPKAVQVSLNGRSLGAYGVDVTTVDLPEGENELLFESPACYSERVTIPADADPGDIRLRLRWKPALLLVRTEQPKDADVLVDGHLGRTGQVLALPLRSDDGRATVEVKVSAAGFFTLTRRIEIRANQLTPLDVSLSPSEQ